MTKAGNALYRFLRWSEQYTRTDMIYLARGGAWLFVGYIAQAASGLILVVAFANLLPKEVYGAYQFIVSMAGIMGIFTLNGMTAAVMRASAQGSKSALRYGFRLQLIASVGILLLGAALALYYHLQGNDALAAAFLIVGALQPLVGSAELYRSFLIGSQRFREKAITDILQRLIPLAAIIATLLLTDNVVLIVAASFGANAMSLYLMYRYFVHAYQLTDSAEPEVARFGAHLSAMNGLHEIAANIDKILIWNALGAAPLAAYSLAQVPIMQMTSLLQLVYSLTFPKLAQKSYAELTAILAGKIRRYFVLVLLAVIAYIAAAPLIFAFLFPAYPEAVLYSQLLALALLAVPRGLIDQALTAHEKVKELYIIHVTSPVVRITLLCILLPLYGVLGAIAAVLATEAFKTVLQWYLFHHSRP